MGINKKCLIKYLRISHAQILTAKMTTLSLPCLNPLEFCLNRGLIIELNFRVFSTNRLIE